MVWNRMRTMKNYVIVVLVMGVSKILIYGLGKLKLIVRHVKGTDISKNENH